MSETLYRIKPLVWTRTQPELDDCCGPIETAGGYTVRRLHGGTKWYVLGGHGERYDSAAEAKASIKNSLAENLIASGVIEPMDESEARRG